MISTTNGPRHVKCNADLTNHAEVRKMKKMWKKLIMMVLAISLCLSCMGIATAHAAEEADTLNKSMDYLVNECGPRLYGTPNEAKAAAYVKEQFESFGYTDVQWVTPELNSVGYSGMLTFSDGSADIYGNCYPSNFEKITAKLVNVGAAEAVVLPEGVSGEIIAAAAFEGSLNVELLSSVVDQIKAANADVTVKGLLLAKKDSIKVTSPGKNDRDAMNQSTIPCVVTTQYFLDKAIANADKLTGMEVCTKTNTNAVIATKAAATDDPDAIIIVTAHLDSVIAAPGASDNATGVSACIELANKFSEIDNGNIKLMFAAVGAEEGGGMLGSMYIINSLTPEEKAIAINLNMDMLGGIQPAYDDAPLNAVSMDIYCGRGQTAKALTLNLPAYLVTDGAKNITWAEGIENVRIFKYGSSDHQKFQEAGIEAASMIIVPEADDDIETINHSSADTIENNYSYDRLKMCTGLIANGIQKAIDGQLSKKAELLVITDEAADTMKLVNAQQLFKMYDKVAVTLTEKVAAAAEGQEAPAANVVELTFTPDAIAKTVEVDLAAYEISAVAYGTGIADNNNAERNEQLKNFSAALVCEVEEKSAVAIAVENMIDAIGEVTKEDKAAIAAAKAAYESLSAEQKAQVNNLDTLKAAEIAMQKLEAPATADATQIALLTGLMLMSLLATAVVLKKKHA